MPKQALDDFEAVRAIITALDGFQPADQERILRWAREKIGLPSNKLMAASARDEPRPLAAPASSGPPPGQAQDIKTFVQSKNPHTDTQFAAAVAYYYRFEAPEPEKKESITSGDLQEATRKVGRDRLTKPAQTLGDAHRQGLLDRAERGAYTINTVGENLVAMALGAASGDGNSTVRRRSRGAGKKAARPQKRTPNKTPKRR
jgi:hypothetical protein